MLLYTVLDWLLFSPIEEGRADMKIEQEIGLDGKLVSTQSEKQVIILSENTSNFTECRRRETWCYTFKHHLYWIPVSSWKHSCFKPPKTIAIDILTGLCTFSAVYFETAALRFLLFPYLSFCLTVHPLLILPDSGYALISDHYLQKAICHGSLLGLPKIASQ